MGAGGMGRRMLSRKAASRSIVSESRGAHSSATDWTESDVREGRKPGISDLVAGEVKFEVARKKIFSV